LKNPFVIFALGAVVAFGVLAGVSYINDARAATVAAEVGEVSTARVIPDKCVGCGRCVAAAPEAFAWDETNRKASVKPDAPAAGIEAGIAACPVDAIVR